MPEVISSGLINAKNEIHSLSPFIWLVELQIDDTTSIAICGHESSVVFGGVTYIPFPITVSPGTRDSGGRYSSVTVSISNIDREFNTLINNGKLLDRRATVRVVHKNDLTSSSAVTVYTIVGISVSRLLVAVTLGIHNIMDSQFPADRFQRTRCGWLKFYGGSGCGYDLSMPNAISGTNPLFDPTKCDGGIDTSNGCSVHGDNEVANGRPRLHPLRARIFPGIPKGPARV